jgi:hypothetical protein
MYITIRYMYRFKEAKIKHPKLNFYSRLALVSLGFDIQGHSEGGGNGHRVPIFFHLSPKFMFPLWLLYCKKSISSMETHDS